jgi:hypothetical protein
LQKNVSMLTDTRKIHIIEAVLKTDDEHILSEVEKIVNGSSQSKVSEKDFFGIWSKEDADTMEKVIEEGCEQINPDDWK